MITIKSLLKEITLNPESKFPYTLFHFVTSKWLKKYEKKLQAICNNQCVIELDDRINDVWSIECDISKLDSGEVIRIMNDLKAAKIDMMYHIKDDYTAHTIMNDWA